MAMLRSIRRLPSITLFCLDNLKEKPFLVHSITPKAGLLTMTAAYLARVPHRIHTFTGLIFPYKEGIMQKILIRTDKILCACATKVYPEGNGVKTDLKKFKITNKPLKIIANGNINGIDLTHFNPIIYNDTQKNKLKKKLNINTTDHVFVFVGRLVKDKGINELIAAFKSLSKTEKNIKLLLVGTYEKDLDPVLPETEEEINTNQQIISVGWQEDVRPYFAISNCLVFPSYREGFPNVVIQAGAMGIASIVTNISGCNEIIINDENGIIIPKKDTESIINAIKYYLSNQSSTLKNSEHIRNMIVDRYDQKLVWESLLKEYQALEKNN